MSSTTLVPLHFASHLFALTVALAAAIVIGRSDQRTLSRVTGALGFLALAGAEIAHGAGFVTDASSPAAFVRTAGYVLVLASALGAPGGELAGVIAAPARVLPPAIAALAAGIALGWRGRERGRLAMAAGLVAIGAGESILAIPESSFDGAGVLAHAVRTVGWGVVALGVVSATRRSIRFRLVAMFLAVLLVVVMVVSSALTQVIGNNLRSEVAARVASETDALAGRFGPQAVDAVRRAVVLSQGLRETLGRSPDTVNRDLDLIRKILTDLDFIVLVGRTGVLGQSGQNFTPVEALELAGSDVAASATAGREAASVDSLGSSGVVIVGAAPVGAGADPLGVVIAGYRVDDSLLRFLAPGTPAFVARDGAAVASSVPGLPAGGALPPELTRRVEREVVERGRRVTGRATLGGRDYFLSARPLERSDGAVVGALVGTEPAELLAAAERGVNRVLFLVTLGAVAMALVLSLLFARRFTRPVRTLTAAARRVREGDLSTKAPVSGEDEVGDLAVAFNRMTESLGDMTDSLRRAAEEEARLRDQLETVLDSMGDGLVAVDAEGCVVTFNPAAERVTGMSRKKAAGRPLGEVLRGRTREGKPLPENPSGPAFIKRKGSDVPVAISSSPITGGGGETLGRVFVIRDRSREAEIERLKREFLATVSHELRTPLTPIVGYSELLARREVTGERVAEFARGILESARRLERIVGMLLDYSAIEAGRMPVEPEPVQLRPLVVRLVEEWRERAPSHTFVTRFAPGVPPALVDIALFRRTLDELLDNAVKYSPDGGTIQVAIRPDGRNGRSGVQIEVSDEGIGIPAKQLPRIFQDFRQLDGSDTRAFGGLGLGLAFVRRIVQAHRGTITAESRPGEGTTFRVGFRAAPGNGRRR